MKRIGVISDTHGHWDEKLANFLNSCDEIWHAGDIGNIKTAETISELKPLKAVHGNIDDARVRNEYPQFQRFHCEDVDVLITHIGGYPGKYERNVRDIFDENPPTLFICGHSHILKVMFDKKYSLLHINPGAAGRSGFHQVRTAVRFGIEGKNITNLEVLELPKH